MPHGRTDTAYPMAVDGARLPPVRRPSPGTALRVGFIGRVVEGKGVHLLVDAVASLRRRGCDAELTVAGAGSARFVGELEKRARLLGVPLHLAGEVVPDRFVESVDIVVVPSIAPEAFGRVPVEMALRGIPTLVSPRGGLPEAAAMVPGRSLVLDAVTPEAIARALLSASGVFWDGASTAQAAPATQTISVALHALLAQIEGHAATDPP